MDAAIMLSKREMEDMLIDCIKQKLPVAKMLQITPTFNAETNDFKGYYIRIKILDGDAEKEEQPVSNAYNPAQEIIDDINEASDNWNKTKHPKYIPIEVINEELNKTKKRLRDHKDNIPFQLEIYWTWASFLLQHKIFQLEI